MAESLQRNLLSTFLKSRDAWEAVRDKISDSVFEQDPYATKIVQLTDEFYNKDKEATRVSIPIILEQVDIRVAAVKQKETLTYLIKELDASEVSVENVVDLAIELKRKEMGDRLGAALLNGGSKEDQHRLMQEYQDLLEMQTFDESEAEEEYNNVSVSEVVSNVVNPHALIKLAPKALNDALDGGAMPGHHITLIARPNCFADGTEVLTSDGWIDLAKVTYETSVAQVHADRTTSWANPLEIVQYDVDEELVWIHDTIGRVNQFVTKDHTVVQGHKGKLIEKPAIDAFWNHYYCMHTASPNRASGQDVLTPLERLYIAFQADGSHCSQVKSGACTGIRYGTLPVRFAFKKERKIARLKEILKACEIQYSESPRDTARGLYSEFYVKLPIGKLASKLFDWVKPSTRSVAWLRAFIEELSWWDATRRTEQRYKYDTTVKYNADVVQEVCVLAGYSCFHSVFPADPTKPHTDSHSLTIRTNYSPPSGQAIKKELVRYKGTVRCVRVPEGKIIVRRKGAVAISGNCGKTALLTTMMHGLALQELDVIYFGNEDPIMSVMQRTMSCITGMTKAEIASDPTRAQELLAKRSWSRLRFIPLTPGTLWEVEKYVKRYRPKVVLIDQMRNMLIKAGTRTEGYEELAKGIRNIGKKYGCLMIDVTQAGDSASNKLVLEMPDCDGSNTGIPGACDVMLAIGMNAEYEKQGLRMISLPKNKLGASGLHFPVKLRADISRYETI